MSLASERRWGVLAALRAQFDLKAARTTSELGRMKAGHLFQMPGLLSVLTDSGLDGDSTSKSHYNCVGHYFPGRESQTSLTS